MESLSSETIHTNKIFLPSSRLVLLLGIFSIIGCWFYGVIGLVSGYFSYSLSKKGLFLHHNLDDRKYDDKALKAIKAARIYAIIGMSLSALYLLLWIIKLIA